MSMDFLTVSFAPKLAARLGDTTHVSPLLRRLFAASNAGKQLPNWLLKVAAERGASKFTHRIELNLPADNPLLLPADNPLLLPADNPLLTDEEVATGLCLGHMPDDPDLIEAAAQLLSSPATDVARLLWLAETERTEMVVRHIADMCAETAPELEPWKTVRERLHPRRLVRKGALPPCANFLRPLGNGETDTNSPRWLLRHEQAKQP